MGLFSFIEIFFFISLGVTILLIALLVYHFKQRITSLEQKYDSLFDIVSNVVKQLRNIQSLSTGNTSEREDALFREPAVSQQLPSQYLGNSSISSISMNANISSPEQYRPHIFHQIIDPSVESSRFIIDYDSQFIREMPNVRDTVISEENSDIESDSGSDIDSESESDAESYVESNTSETKHNKIVVSDDDNSMVDINGHARDLYREVSKEQLSNEVEDVRIITLPPILENIQDELNVQEIELHTEDTDLEPHLNSNSITPGIEYEINPSLNTFNTNAYIVQKVDGNELEQPSFNEPSSIGKELYKKMTLPNLKATVIAKGLCSDPSKMKKSDLLKLLEEE